MLFQNKSILLISPEPWDHISVSKHHYAIHLGARGNKVFFLNPPSALKSLTATKYKNVLSVTYDGFSKGLRLYPSFFQRFFIRKKFEELQRLCGVTFDVVWSFDNSVFFDFSALPDHVLKISHIVDLNQDFQTRTAARTADFCFCTTTYIQDKLSKFNNKSFKIQHGFNEIQSSEDALLPGNAQVKAVYTGNLSMPYLDWAIMEKVIKAHQSIDFIFIGPNADDFNLETNLSHVNKRRVFESKNVYLIDRIPADKILSYTQKADILLVFYKEEHHHDQANPHKMMEYLGSGRVIVATFTEEFYGHPDLIGMSEDNAELPELLSRVSRDLDFFNSDALILKRKAYALDNTYNLQINRIEHIIESHR